MKTHKSFNEKGIKDAVVTDWDTDILISIIIPVYNVRPYLTEALESVVNQTYNHLEILIIDDGSTDGSSEICDKYAMRDQRIRVIHQKNKGLSNARNVGLDKMTGDLIAFLDSDDAYHPSFIEKMLDSMIHRNVDLVVSRYTSNQTEGFLGRGGEKGPLHPLIEGIYDCHTALKALADGSINVSVWNKLYRRELWDNIRFPDGHVFEDLDTTYRIVNCSRRIYVLDEILYYYRKRSGSITEIQSYENINDRLLAYSHFSSFVQKQTPNIYTTKQLRRVFSTKFNVLILAYIHGLDASSYENIFFRNQIRKKTLKLADKEGTDLLGVRTKTLFYMLRFCPRSLRVAYYIYHLIWRIIRLIIKRS